MLHTLSANCGPGVRHLRPSFDWTALGSRRPIWELADRQVEV